MRACAGSSCLGCQKPERRSADVTLAVLWVFNRECSLNCHQHSLPEAKIKPVESAIGDLCSRRRDLAAAIFQIELFFARKEFKREIE
jgi:hypothetical protein